MTWLDRDGAEECPPHMSEANSDRRSNYAITQLR